jgi:hypothetical protein
MAGSCKYLPALEPQSKLLSYSCVTLLPDKSDVSGSGFVVVSYEL